MTNISILRIAAVLFAAAAPALASAKAGAQDGSVCARIAEDRKRLDCYDLQYSNRASLALPTGRWSVVEELSPIDDSLNVQLSVDSPQPIDGDERARLWIACIEGDTVVWVSFGGKHMADFDSWGTVTYRIDKARAFSTRMASSTDGRSLVFADPDIAIAFARRLFGANTLVVRATPFHELETTVGFPIAGLAEAIKPLRKACNW